MTSAPRIDPITRLADEIAELEAHISAASYRQLVAIRAFDELQGWAEQGALSCAAWLTWRIGMSPAAARERVRMAGALSELPDISGAFAQGTLSYSQVRAITRIATPASEAEWLNVARHCTGAHLERIVRACRQSEIALAPDHAQAQQASRELRTFF